MIMIVSKSEYETSLKVKLAKQGQLVDGERISTIYVVPDSWVKCAIEAKNYEKRIQKAYLNSL